MEEHLGDPFTIIKQRKEEGMNRRKKEKGKGKRKKEKGKRKKKKGKRKKIHWEENKPFKLEKMRLFSGVV